MNNRIEGLDELRGIAILVVIFHHLSWALGNYQLGGPAVDLFFIISGFLIGRILIKSKDREGYFKHFYGRRIFRIAPLAIVTIAGCFVLSKILGWNTDSLPYYLFFIQNYIPVQEVVGNHPDWRGGLAGADPLWSLAVEEHFYLVVPLLIRNLKLRNLLIVCFLVALTSIHLKNNYIGQNDSYYYYTNPGRTECRAVYLVAGLMLNFTNYRFLFLGVITAFWIGSRLLLETTPGKLDIAGFIVLFLIVDLTIRQKLRIRCKWLAWAGRICYSLYLIHMPIALALKQASFAKNIPFILAVYIGATFVLAALSFYFFEEPVRRWGYRRLEKSI